MGPPAKAGGEQQMSSAGLAAVSPAGQTGPEISDSRQGSSPRLDFHQDLLGNHPEATPRPVHFPHWPPLGSPGSNSPDRVSGLLPCLERHSHPPKFKNKTKTTKTQLMFPSESVTASHSRFLMILKTVLFI